LNTLEDHSNAGQETAEAACKPAAKSQNAGEEGACGEKESDQHEGKHKPSQEEVIACADELRRDSFSGAECSSRWRVQWVCGMNRAATVESIRDAAGVPVGPPCQGRRTRYTACGCFQEIPFVDWGGIYRSREDDEQHEKQGAGDQD